MSGCADFCLSDADCYDSPAELYSERIVTARKPHLCCECRKDISRGERYQRASGKSDGEMWVLATCVICTEIRAAFSCGGWVFAELWSQVYEEMFSEWERLGPYDCLAKLETREARDKLMAEYAEWREARS